MITFHVITLFPESLESYLNASIINRAKKERNIAIKYYNPRDFAVSAKQKKELTYAERRVDDRPYGGGPGMVIEALPVVRAIAEAVGRRLGASNTKRTVSGAGKPKKFPASRSKVKIVFFSPSGRQFTNTLAETFKRYSDIVLVCGRYEGIDARVKKIFPMANITVGPYVLTGGELPAMVVIDAITRRIPGVLGDDLSVEESRVACSDVYTRPAVIEYRKKKYRVPRILMSGHRAKIDAWKTKSNK